MPVPDLHCPNSPDAGGRERARARPPKAPKHWAALLSVYGPATVLCRYVSWLASYLESAGRVIKQIL